MNFGMKHAPGAGLINQPVDLQSSALILCYGFPPEYSYVFLLCIQYFSIAITVMLHCNTNTRLYSRENCTSHIRMRSYQHGQDEVRIEGDKEHKDGGQEVVDGSSTGVRRHWNTTITAGPVPGQ